MDDYHGVEWGKEKNANKSHTTWGNCYGGIDTMEHRVATLYPRVSEKSSWRT